MYEMRVFMAGGVSMKYKRLGTCARCGNCCKVLRFQVPSADTSKEFYLARGLMPFLSKHDGLTYVMINHRCPNLGEDNLCKVQKVKPTTCRLYPAHPMHHEGIDCKYRWKEGEDDTNKTS